VILNTNLDAYEYQQAFSANSLANHQPSTNTNDMASSAEFIRTVDQLIASISSSNDPTEIKMKKLSEKVADYVIARLTATAFNYPCLSCWKTNPSISGTYSRFDMILNF